MAACGDPYALSALGYLYLRGGGGLLKNEQEALRLLREAAAKAQPLAISNLGLMHWKGLGGLPKNEAEAARLFADAARTGVAVAMYNLALMHLQGLGGLTRNDAVAFQLMSQAVQKCGSLASMHLSWWNSNQLNDVALTLFRATEASEAVVVCGLAFLYQTGRGTPQNQQEAIRLYKLAAERGNEAGMYHLGLAYESGIGGLARSPEEAMRLYAAAQHEIPDAGARLQSLQRSKRIKETATDMAGEAVAAAAKALIRNLLK